MEPTKQVDADPSGLDDPGQPRDGSSSRQPPRWPLLEQEQEPAMAPLMHMPLVERATPPPPNSPQLLQPQGHDVVGGSSTLAGFRSNYDIWGLDIAGAPVARPMFHPDSRWPSTPNFINNQFSGAAAPFSASGHYTSLSPHAFVPLTAPFANQPAPSFNQRPSASHWASMPSSSSANGPQPGAATAFFPRGHNASLDPYAFPRLAAPLANQADGSQLLSSPQAICFLTDEQFRARLFGCPRLPSLVMSREISARRVVLMLHEGDDRDLRLWVLDAILRNVHMVMGSRAGSAVCLALLRAVLPQELCCIVQAASSPPLDRTSLMGVARTVNPVEVTRVVPVEIVVDIFHLHSWRTSDFDCWISYEKGTSSMEDRMESSVAHNCVFSFTWHGYEILPESVSMRGPAYTSMFSSLSVIFTILGALLLGEKVTIGGLSSASMVITGLSLYLYGKAKDGSSSKCSPETE